MDFEIRTEGLDDFTLRFRAIKEYRDEIRETLEEAAEKAGLYMTTHVPYDRGQLFSAIEVSPIRYAPGGSGGGGYYEIEVGVDESTAPHAEWVLEGTGLFNRENPTNGIFPDGNALRWHGQEGKIFAAWTKGQKPQREWFEGAIRLADAIVDRKVRGRNR